MPERPKTFPWILKGKLGHPPRVDVKRRQERGLRRSEEQRIERHVDGQRKTEVREYDQYVSD